MNVWQPFLISVAETSFHTLMQCNKHESSRDHLPQDSVPLIGTVKTFYNVFVQTECIKHQTWSCSSWWKQPINAQHYRLWVSLFFQMWSLGCWFSVWGSQPLLSRWRWRTLHSTCSSALVLSEESSHHCSETELWAPPTEPGRASALHKVTKKALLFIWNIKRI